MYVRGPDIITVPIKRIQRPFHVLLFYNIDSRYLQSIKTHTDDLHLTNDLSSKCSRCLCVLLNEGEYKHVFYICNSFISLCRDLFSL